MRDVELPDTADSLPGDKSEPLGVSGFLPKLAALTLVRAAEHARTLPDGSLARAKVVSEAIRKVKAAHGAYFVQRDDNLQ